MILFSANLAKGNMSFCHHLVSVVCHPFTFHILIFSSEYPQPNELKLGRKHLWKDLSKLKECTICYDPLPNMATTGNSCFWLADLKKSFSLKPLGQMNLVGSIYGGSSIKIAHFVPIRYQTWPPQIILVSDWLISKKSSPLTPLSLMNWKLVWSIYGRSSIRLLILSRSIDKHGRHRQFLFLIGRFF